jgi:hypothetical protein
MLGPRVMKPLLSSLPVSPIVTRYFGFLFLAEADYVSTNLVFGEQVRGNLAILAIFYQNLSVSYHCGFWCASQRIAILTQPHAAAQHKTPLALRCNRK